MLVTICNTKGGVGKSTLTLNLAVMRARESRRVLLINADKQDTLQSALAVREAQGRPVPFKAVKIPDWKQLDAYVHSTAARAFDDVLIDVGGRDTETLRAAMSLADTVVVPWVPRSSELWELPTMSRLLEQARQHKPALRVLSCLNMADPAGSDNWTATAAIRAYPIFAHIARSIVRRKAVSDAFGRGLAALEDRPASAKSVLEFRAVVRAVFDDAGTMPANH